MYGVEGARRENPGGLCGCIYGCVFGAGGVAVLAILVCAGLYLYIQDRMPQPPNPDFTPNAVSAEEFETVIRRAETTIQQGEGFNVAVTEDQASSWINLRAEDVVNQEVPFDNIQVQFQNGATTVYGEIDALGLNNIGTNVSLYYNITPTGELDVSVGEISFGGVNVPESFRQELNTEIQSAINSELFRLSGQYRVSDITVYDGQLVIRGTTN